MGLKAQQAGHRSQGLLPSHPHTNFVLQNTPYAPIKHRRRRDCGLISASLTVTLYDLHSLQVPYEQAWAWQKKLVQRVALQAVTHTHTQRVADSSTKGGGAGAALLLQHTPTYTLGAGASEDHLNFDPATPPAPLFRIERGGEVTYHGPGQLVMYPILDLKQFRADLHWYLRALEEVVIRALDDVSGLEGKRIDGLTGVWVNGCKVAAIGVRATRWVSYHGLALNVATDLAPFKSIVPCGIADRPVGSVDTLVHGQLRTMDPFAGPAALELDAQEERKALVEEYRYGLLASAEDVFGLTWELVEGEAAIAELEAMTYSSDGIG